MYLSNPAFMQEVHKRIIQNLDPYQEYLMVSHSFGTVIAYNLLHKNKLCQINRLMTLGSPVTFKVIQSLDLNIFQEIRLIVIPRDDFLTVSPLYKPYFDYHPVIKNMAINTLIITPLRVIS